MLETKLFYCYTTRQNYNDYGGRNEEFIYAKNRRDTLFYDYNQDAFYNGEKKVVDINGKRILLRGCIEKIEFILEKISERGGIPINSISEINQIKNWNKEIKTFRHTLMATGQNLLENEDVKEKVRQISLDNQFFLKTVEKDFSGCVELDELLDKRYGLLDALKLHQEDEFMISEPIEILKDGLGNLEYRCFVVNGKIISISRALFLTLHSISPEIFKYASTLLEKIMQKQDFPRTFVMDFMLYVVPGTDTVLCDLLELNPLEASGEYLYNTIYLEAIPKKGLNTAPVNPNIHLSSQEMLELLPIYKRNKKGISFSNQEPKKIMYQSYHTDGFSYHYGCAKKFGNAMQERFWIHTYCGRYGPSNFMDIEEILNGNIAIQSLLDDTLIENLYTSFGILIDKEKIEKGILLEEEQLKRERKRLDKK